MIINSIYNCYAIIINGISIFSQHIQPKYRELLFKMSLLCLSMIGIAAYCNKTIKRLVHYNDYALEISVFLLIILLISSIEKPIEKQEAKKIKMSFFFGWLLCFLFMNYSSFKFYVRKEYFLFSVLGITVLPMLIIVWQNNNNYKHLFRTISKINVITSIIFLMVNLAVVPFVSNKLILEAGDLGFLGIVANPNSNGLIALPFFTASLYLILTEDRPAFVDYLSLCISVMFAYISLTRTAELAIGLEVVAAIVLAVRHKEESRRIVNSNVIVAIIGAIIIALAAGVILSHMDVIDMNAYAESEYEETYNYVYSDNTLSAINTLSSGRLVLWLSYLKKVEFWGHGNPDGALFSEISYSKWAHNNALDIWYASGLPAALGYMLMLICGWFFVFKCLIKKKGFRNEYLLTILAFIGYFTEAMLEITLYPMYTGIAFLCFATLGPIAFKEKTDEV